MYRAGTPSDHPKDVESYEFSMMLDNYSSMGIEFENSQQSRTSNAHVRVPGCDPSNLQRARKRNRGTEPTRRLTVLIRLTMPIMRRARPLSLASVVLLVTVVTVSVLAAETRPSAPEPFRVVFDRSLPFPIEWAFDVRWLDDETVVLAAGRAGLYALPVSDPEAPPRHVAGSEQLEWANRLAVSKTYLVTAAPFGIVEWKPRDGSSGWQRDVPMSVIVDFDVHGDRVLLLGARRVRLTAGAKPVWAPEGGILFSGELEGDLGALQRRMTARSGIDGKAMEMARCQVLEPGAVRFLSDGRYAVLPGVQPGVLVYGADGRLLRAWETEPLGIYDECDIGPEEQERISVDLSQRIAWWQSHTVTNDLVPWGDGFAVVVREPTEGGAVWRLVPFGDEGPEESLPLPVDGSSEGLHLRGDVRGGRLLLLLFDYEEVDGAPRNRPRLLVLERSGE